jgi:predicted DNA-binding transcriptional regulator AlpA
MSKSSGPWRRRPSRRCLPPPEGVRWLTVEQVAGLFGKPRSWVNRVRATNAAFPRPVLLGSSSPRWRLEELDAWAMALPRGYANTGGRRPSDFGRGLRTRARATDALVWFKANTSALVAAPESDGTPQSG